MGQPGIPKRGLGLPSTLVLRLELLQLPGVGPCPVPCSGEFEAHEFLLDSNPDLLPACQPEPTQGLGLSPGGEITKRTLEVVHHRYRKQRVSERHYRRGSPQPPAKLRDI